MRAVVQRVTNSHVIVDGQTVGAIGQGLLIFLGVEQGDSPGDAKYLADKISHLRIFPDQAGKMNRSVLEADGSVLVVSQFTLLGDCRKGRRPSFISAAPPALAKDLYEQFCHLISEAGVAVQTGIFQADMQVHLINDGPVTLILNSRE